MKTTIDIAICALLALCLGLSAVAAARAAARVLGRAGLRMGAAASVVFAAFAIVATVAAQKSRISFDALIADAGSYATNDVLHVAATNAAAYASLDLSESPVLVYARESSSTNAADWAELLPRRTFGELPADYAIANATSYLYMVYLDYVPPSPVHLNGVFELRGFVVGEDVDPGTGSGERTAGFINSRPIKEEE